MSVIVSRVPRDSDWVRSLGNDTDVVRRVSTGCYKHTDNKLESDPYYRTACLYVGASLRPSVRKTTIASSRELRRLPTGLFEMLWHLALLRGRSNRPSQLLCVSKKSMWLHFLQ